MRYTNSQKTTGRQLKKINQLSLPRELDCKTRTDNKTKTNKEPPQTQNTPNPKPQTTKSIETASNRTVTWPSPLNQHKQPIPLKHPQTTQFILTHQIIQSTETPITTHFTGTLQTNQSFWTHRNILLTSYKAKLFQNLAIVYIEVEAHQSWRAHQRWWYSVHFKKGVACGSGFCYKILVCLSL